MNTLPKELISAQFNIVINGIMPIMFDRFYDHSTKERPIEDCLYLDDDGFLYIPDEYFYSFLFRVHRPYGCLKKFNEMKASEFEEFYSEAQSCISFPDPKSYFEQNGERIKVTKIDGDSRFFKFESAPIVNKSGNPNAIKSPGKPRPTLLPPWSLKVPVVIANFSKRITKKKVQEWFGSGGVVVGFGSYRPRFGKFICDFE